MRQVLRYAQETGAKRDVTPELYLAVAIHKVPEKEQEAVSLFASAFQHLDESGVRAPGPRSELWARASWARLLRRLDRVQEAEAQEQAILYVGISFSSLICDPCMLPLHRDWIVSHPLVLPGPKLRALVSDETDSGPLNAIVEHPEVLVAIERARERTRVPRA